MITRQLPWSAVPLGATVLDPAGASWQLADRSMLPTGQWLAWLRSGGQLVPLPHDPAALTEVVDTPRNFVEHFLSNNFHVTQLAEWEEDHVR